jgi:hypothetical protein
MFKYIDELAASTGVQADMLKMAFALIASLLLSISSLNQALFIDYSLVGQQGIF